MMKLSDALILGSTFVQLRPSDWRVCALGAAARVVGILPDDSVAIVFVSRILDEWPWLSANCDEPLKEIVTLFDQRVCRGEMTLEELVAHVASMEPPCECGVRGCVCDRIEGMAEPVAEYEEVAQ